MEALSHTNGTGLMFQPVQIVLELFNDLLGILGKLSRQFSPNLNALYRLNHVQPGAAVNNSKRSYLDR